MNVGGPAVLITELANAFPESDIEHLLVTGVCESNEIDYLDTHPIKGRVKYLRSVRRSIFFFADLKSFFLLVREIRNFRPHIIHTHTTKAGVLGRLAAALSSRTARVVHTYHGHLLYGYFSKWKVLIVVMIEKLMAKLSDILVAVSIQVRDDLLRVKVGKRSQWHVIRPGVIPGKSMSRSQGRKELSVSENAFLIAWVGRFTDIKNPELAIRAVEHLAAGREVILIMAGDGELLEKCKKYSKEKDLPALRSKATPGKLNLTRQVALTAVGGMIEIPSACKDLLDFRALRRSFAKDWLGSTGTTCNFFMMPSF
jgi:glycosyltransferase involved in cell wall biosynthesis